MCVLLHMCSCMCVKSYVFIFVYFCVCFLATGKRFAEQEMHVFLIRLLQNFRVEWRESVTMAQKYNMLLTPDVPANFTFIPRDPAL